MSDTKGWIELLNSPLPTLWGVGMATSIAWMVTKESWFGLLALLFICIACAHTVAKSWPQIKKKLDKKRREKALRKRVHSLTSKEKTLLSEFVEQDTRSLTLSLNDETVVSLVGWGILIRGSSISSGDIYFPFVVHGQIWDYLKKHPEVLESKRMLEGA